MKDEETQKAEEAFYKSCGDILGSPHAYREFPYRYKTRWNNRNPGNGRFSGCGIIRVFGSRVHISLYAPTSINRWCESFDDALAVLRSLVA